MNMIVHPSIILGFYIRLPAMDFLQFPIQGLMGLILVSFQDHSKWTRWCHLLRLCSINTATIYGYGDNSHESKFDLSDHPMWTQSWIPCSPWTWIPFKQEAWSLILYLWCKAESRCWGGCQLSWASCAHGLPLAHTKNIVILFFSVF